MDIQILITFIFGVVFIIALIVLATVFPKPTPFQDRVFRIVLALAAAGVAAMIPGFINVEFSSIAGLLIRAGGAIAVFIIVYFFTPALMGISTTQQTELSSNLQMEGVKQKEVTPNKIEVLVIDAENRYHNIEADFPAYLPWDTFVSGIVSGIELNCVDCEMSQDADQYRVFDINSGNWLDHSLLSVSQISSVAIALVDKNNSLASADNQNAAWQIDLMIRQVSNQ